MQSFSLDLPRAVKKIYFKIGMWECVVFGWSEVNMLLIFLFEVGGSNEKSCLWWSVNVACGNLSHTEGWLKLRKWVTNDWGLCLLDLFWGLGGVLATSIIAEFSVPCYGLYWCMPREKEGRFSVEAGAAYLPSGKCGDSGTGSCW